MGEGAEDLIERVPDELEAIRNLGDVVERHSGDEVHHKKRCAVAKLSEVPRANDAGMIQGGEGTRLLVKPHDVFGRELALRRDDALEGHDLTGREIFAAIDDAHAAFAQHADHLVALGEDVPGQHRARRPEGSDLVSAQAQDRALLQGSRGRDARRGALRIRVGFDGRWRSGKMRGCVRYAAARLGFIPRTSAGPGFAGLFRFQVGVAPVCHGSSRRECSRPETRVEAGGQGTQAINFCLSLPQVMGFDRHRFLLALRGSTPAGGPFFRGRGGGRAVLWLGHERFRPAPGRRPIPKSPA